MAMVLEFAVLIHKLNVGIPSTHAALQLKQHSWHTTQGRKGRRTMPNRWTMIYQRLWARIKRNDARAMPFGYSHRSLCCANIPSLVYKLHIIIRNALPTPTCIVWIVKCMHEHAPHHCFIMNFTVHCWPPFYCVLLVFRCSFPTQNRI